MAAAKVEQLLQEAVDWKVFEWQAVLVGTTNAEGKESDESRITAEALEKSKAWLQPRHYVETVIERATDGRCGYPCCTEKINVPGNNDGPRYQIDYRNKTFHEAEDVQYYCRKNNGKCFRESTAFQTGMDSSLVITRDVAKKLDIKSKTSIDNILQTLSIASGEDEIDEESIASLQAGKSIHSGKKGKNKGGDVEQTAPPVFNNPNMSAKGTLKPLMWSVKNSYKETNFKITTGGTHSQAPPALAQNSEQMGSPVVKSATSARAVELLDQLQKDPTKLGLGLGLSGSGKPTSQSPQKGAATGAGSASNTPSKATPSKVKVAASSASKANNSSPGGGGGASVVGEAAPSKSSPGGDSDSQHPSMKPTFHNHNLDAKTIKELPITSKEKSFIEKMKASRGGSTMNMTMMNQKVPALQAKQDDQEKEEQEASSSSAEASPMKEVEGETLLDDDAAYGPFDGDFNWRENRLDTSKFSSQTMLEASKPNNNLAEPKRKLRMNPKGRRAQELAEKARREAEEKANVNVKEVREKLVPLDGASGAEMRFIEGAEDEVKKPSYKNGNMTAAAREVKWTDPDPALVSESLRSVGRRQPPAKTGDARPSYFKQLREEQRLLEDDKKLAAAVVDGNDQTKDQMKMNRQPPVVDHGKNSAGAKTVSWDIKESDDPTCMPESAIFTKHDDDEEEDGDENNEADEKESSTLQEEEDIKEAEMAKSNRDLRSAFFSNTGISATVIPQGFSSGGNVKKGKKGAKGEEGKTSPTRQEVQKDYDSDEDEEEEEESEGEDENASDYSDDDSFAESTPLTTTKPKMSSFLMMWTALDDYFGHTATILRKPSVTLEDSRNRVEAKGVVDLDYERRNAAYLATSNVLSGSARTITSMMTRGIATAEQSLFLFDVLKPAQLSEYYYTKKKLLSVANFNQECPPLSSSGWSVLGLLVIDGIFRLRRFGDVDNPTEEGRENALREWAHRVDSLIPNPKPSNTTGTASNKTNFSLDEHQIRMLKSFFDDLN